MIVVAQSFENCHALGPQNIAELCSKYNVEKFICFINWANVKVFKISTYKRPGEQNVRKS